MTTFVNDYLSQLKEQWEEIDLLIEEAEKIIDSNTSLYNALCRSASILLVSHLEGFIKDMAKSLVQDLNTNLQFNEMPNKVRRTMCQKYLGFDKSISKNYDSLLNELVLDLSESTDFKLSYEPFLFDKNRNPKPDSIKLVCDRFGLSNIFKNMHESIFDNVFESDKKLEYLLRRFEVVVGLATKEFPYRAKINKFSLTPKALKGGRTLWESFLDDTNHVRHNIVHGNTFSNQGSVMELKRRVNKIKLFKLVVTYCLCATVVKAP